MHVKEVKLCGTMVGSGLGIFTRMEADEKPNLDQVYGAFGLL